MKVGGKVGVTKQPHETQYHEYLFTSRRPAKAYTFSCLRLSVSLASPKETRMIFPGKERPPDEPGATQGIQLKALL
jgi:hypothetical protein